MSCPFHSRVTPTLAQGRSQRLSHHLHTSHDERFSLSCSTSPFTSPCTSPSSSCPSSPCTPNNFDSMTYNLRNSANGTFVTSDDTFLSQVMSPTTWRLNDMELFDTGAERLGPQQVPRLPRIPSSTLLRRQTTTWMTKHSASCSLKYTEDYADCRRPEGVSGQSVVNVCHGRPNGETCGKE